VICLANQASARLRAAQVRLPLDAQIARNKPSGRRLNVISDKAYAKNVLQAGLQDSLDPASAGKQGSQNWKMVGFRQSHHLIWMTLWAKKIVSCPAF
jgi:hypothetical protein